MSRSPQRHAGRAGCAGTRTSGSEGGPAKRTLRKEGTARRSDPYTLSWLHGYRRLLVRYDRDPELHQAFLSLAAALIRWQLLHPD